MNTPTFTDPRARRIGRRIKSKRKALGMTQDQLADTADLSQGAISKWEAGDATPTLASLLKLRAALGMTDDEFSALIDEAS